MHTIQYYKQVSARIEVTLDFQHVDMMPPQQVQLCRCRIIGPQTSFFLHFQSLGRVEKLVPLLNNILQLKLDWKFNVLYK